METGCSNPAVNADFLLVKATRAGDLLAFDKLVGTYQGKLLHVALRITRNRQEAEDVVQKSFLQAFAHLNTFQGGSKFSTWLMRIAINEALMNLRKKHRSPEVSLDECSETEEGWLCREVPDNRATPEESCCQQELYRLLTGVIEQLRPSYRVIVQLRYVKGFSAGETSRCLGLPVSTVKTRLHRARLQLRKMFNQHRPKSSVLKTPISLEFISFTGEIAGISTRPIRH